MDYLSKDKEPRLTGSSLFDVKRIEVLESKDREKWQKPEDIMRYLELSVSHVVADLGCGTGYFSVPISSKVKKVYAIDVQKEMLDYLEKKVQKDHIKNIETLLSTDNVIPLENESVNVLLSVNTMHEFQNRDRIIKEIYRVIKQTGRIVIVDFKKENTKFGPPVNIRISKKQAIDMFKKQNMKIDKIRNLPNQYLLVFRKNL